MKPVAEMNEGPEALTRFEDSMKKLFAAKKSNAPPSPFGKSGKKRKPRTAFPPGPPQG